MKKFLSILLALLMICSMSITGFAAEGTDDTQRLSNEIEANEQYQRLLDNLSKDASSSVGRIALSDYYGGAYINDDGNLVVCVTDDYDVKSAAIQAYTGNEQIITERVKYTYATLEQEQARLTEVYEAMRVASATKEADPSKSPVSSAAEDLFASICSTYIDEEKNIIVVEIENLTTDKIALFQILFSDKDFVEFTEGYTNTTTADWNPGRKIYKSTGGWLSTGYPVYFTNSNGNLERGFVTAGHGYEEGDIVYRSYGGTNELGVCVASAFSGDTDAALIQITSSSYDISEVTYYDDTTLSSNSYSLPAQGSTIYKEGAKTQCTSGTVSSRSVTVYYADATVSDMLKTTALNLGGDSGGVAYTASGSVIGSMSGSSHTGDELTEDTFVCSYICKVANALDTLDCSIWD